MINIIVIGEGQTEEAFVQTVLAPTFAPDEIFLVPRLIPTGPRGRGGALAFQRVQNYLRHTLLERADVYVTTFFDLHALKPDFPGMPEIRRYSDPLQRAAYVEKQFHAAMSAAAGTRPDRFIPHIQPYEFEGLLFTDVEKLTSIEPAWGAFATTLSAARDKARSPEHINDGPTTHPSARLENLRPTYRKTLHGPLIAEAIGLNAIERECAHFAQWLQKLRTLPPLA